MVSHIEQQPENITAKELFLRVEEILDSHHIPSQSINKMMHEVVVLVCHEGLKSSQQAFGNLFSQVDFLCKRHHIAVSDTLAIQKMRRDSNQVQPISHEELLDDCRALSLLISAVFDTDIPSSLTVKIPVTFHPKSGLRHIDYRCLRCIVKRIEETRFSVVLDQDEGDEFMEVDYSAEHLRYLQDVLQEGMQLNLLDVSRERNVLIPRLIIVEPDYLLDISSLARCFTDYGHHPLSFTLNRLSPNANSQAILIGNFAGSALDDIINGKGNYLWTETFIKNFKERALEYCTCPDLNKKEDFKVAAQKQAQNIQQIVDELFDKEGFRRSHAILEPSFICEQLGIQGRVDLMTTDMKLLVEQKSGSNFSIQTNRPNEYGSFQKEDHYVQLLLYYGVLSRNFNLTTSHVDIRLLYSKYPLPGGLVAVNFYQKLFFEAIRFRNLVVVQDFHIAREGFESILRFLTPDIINEKHISTVFYTKYILPRLSSLTSPLHHLTDLERSYFCRMMTFVYREQLASRLGVQEGIGNSCADLWNMPIAEKKETGNIYTGLQITKKEKSTDYNGYDTITLAVPDQGIDFLPNFRTGDSIYLYAYHKDKEPDVRASILFKGSLVRIHSDELVVHLNDGQQNPAIIHGDAFAIEHSEMGGNAGIKGLFLFAVTTSDRRSLLLAQRAPRKDQGLSLSRSYHPSYDEILLKAKQAQDYFLLVGPPGTGKTSMALHYMVEEQLASSVGDILLLSYTNRAVDEICGMLCDHHLNFIRIGNEYTCDERFRPHLLQHAINDCPRLSAIQYTIRSTRIIVGTTTTIQSQSYLFNLKHFSIAIIDEASQILEPNLIGLLSMTDGGNKIAIDKFILIGDYKQLPAVVQQDPTASAINEPILRAIGIKDGRDSLFERLIRWEHHEHRSDFMGILRKQGRMHPDLAEFPNKMFYSREHLEPVPCPHQLETAIYSSAPTSIDPTLPYLNLLLRQRVIFIPSEFCKRPDLSEKVNTEEARIVRDVLKTVFALSGPSFHPDKTVGVIVPYRNQIAMIRKEIESLNNPILEKISIDTVERYQGSQRDVIIYSFTVQNRYQLDFLTSNCFVEDGKIIDRKLNVALTRARKQVILTGNVPTLSHNLLFKQLIEEVQEKAKACSTKIELPNKNRC